LLIHQIPPKPDYLRVKVGRRLARVGAVALKNTVYVLPRTDGAREDFEWILREVTGAGGDAALLEACFVDGLADADVETMFRTARDADYGALAKDARELDARLNGDDDARRQVESEIGRLERRLEEISALDFFAAPGREVAQGIVAGLRARLTSPPLAPVVESEGSPSNVRSRTWVTRRDVHVDRIASAWLIRRFIDTEASFKFVPAKGYVPEAGELRFDMFAAEYTHEGDQCTFEVLCRRFALDMPGLSAIADLIHDLDLRDQKFGRAEAAGLGAQLTGVTHLHHDDASRIEHGSALFDQLLRYFANRK
jgi:hypothetical protein